MPGGYRVSYQAFETRTRAGWIVEMICGWKWRSTHLVARGGPCNLIVANSYPSIFSSPPHHSDTTDTPPNPSSQPNALYPGTPSFQALAHVSNPPTLTVLARPFLWLYIHPRGVTSSHAFPSFRSSKPQSGRNMVIHGQP